MDQTTSNQSNPKESGSSTSIRCDIGKTDPTKLPKGIKPSVGCNMEFKYKSQLEKHQRSAHVFGYYRCEYCSTLFKHDNKRKAHQEEKHERDGCEVPRSFNSTNTAWSHNAEKRQYECHENDKCLNYMPTDYQNFVGHVSKHREGEKVVFATNRTKCIKCNMECSTRFSAMSHDCVKKVKNENIKTEKMKSEEKSEL